jgi:hypothetical protein
MHPHWQIRHPSRGTGRTDHPQSIQTAYYLSSKLLLDFPEVGLSKQSFSVELAKRYGQAKCPSTHGVIPRFGGRTQLPDLKYKNLV